MRKVGEELKEHPEVLRSPHRMTFEEYSEVYKDFFHFKREDGIIEVQCHYEDGPMQWCISQNRAIQDIWRVLNDDYENECIILTGTGDIWLKGASEGNTKLNNDVGKNPYLFGKTSYDYGYAGDQRIMTNMINDCHIPIVAAINGWSLYHTEFPLICDVTICTPDAEFRDAHFTVGTVPGDGQFLVLQHLLGTKRAAYMTYMNKYLTAQEALELGVVNEVVERDQLLDRAWEIARTITKQDARLVRLTHELVRDPWKKLLNDNFENHFKAEMWGYWLTLRDPESGEDNWFTRLHSNDSNQEDFDAEFK